MAGRAEMPDDFSAPLRGARRSAGVVVALPAAAAAFLAIVLIIFAGWLMLVDDPLGGEPVAVAMTRPDAPAKPAAGDADESPAVAPQAPTATPGPADTPAPAGQTVTIIDGSSGARQTVTVGPSPRQATMPAFDERLVETSPHGLLPRIGSDGTRPSAAYAAPGAKAAASATGPKVAIVVGRLGISASFTSDALTKLPPAATVAFMPYGADLMRHLAQARRDGREALLQVPMEPFDYPDNDPGPLTLLTSLAPAQNVDRLQRVMAAAQGYVGIANFMGARLAAHEPSMAAVMREAGRRGLIYFEDGTARSLAGGLASGSGTAFLRADLVVDAVATAAEIDASLAQLEALARERGSAVGAATALPVTIDRIARWAKAAESRGVRLVPLTALTGRAPSS